METIAQRELRNQSGEVLRRAEQGEQFISVDGRPVAVLGPYRKRQWVTKAEYAGVIQSGPPDPTFFEDIRDMGGSHLDLDTRCLCPLTKPSLGRTRRLPTPSKWQAHSLGRA